MAARATGGEKACEHGVDPHEKQGYDDVDLSPSDQQSGTG